MPDVDSPSPTKVVSRRATGLLVASYVLDWIVLIIAGIIGTLLGRISPNKRHFKLDDPNIGFPFAEKETVNSATLLVCNAVIPIIVILFVVLVFVPGPTVPKGTPSALIWRRKLWELHAGWLGLAMSLLGAWFITSGMKNMFGRPRPDLISRCQPDYANVNQYYVINEGRGGGLVRADICQNANRRLLDDGFRSYPSGHSSSAAAGLVYLSFFLASKFAVVFPFTPSSNYAAESSALAFPSRSRASEGPSPYNQPSETGQIAAHSSTVFAVRRRAAAPPVYLLALTLLPFFLAVFIASSRWFDFRHHGFDILFGFIIGLITAWFSFRYYHLPISRGAGWAWGPRSPDKAFWAGLGVYSYATDKKQWVQNGDLEQGMASHRMNDIEMQGMNYRQKTGDDQFEGAGSSRDVPLDKNHLGAPDNHAYRQDRSLGSHNGRI